MCSTYTHWKYENVNINSVWWYAKVFLESVFIRDNSVNVSKKTYKNLFRQTCDTRRRKITLAASTYWYLIGQPPILSKLHRLLIQTTVYIPISFKSVSDIAAWWIKFHYKIRLCVCPLFDVAISVFLSLLLEPLFLYKMIWVMTVDTQLPRFSWLFLR